MEAPRIYGAATELPPYIHDKEKAKQLLKEAGVQLGTKLTSYSTQGRYVSDRQIAEAIQGQLREVGLEVEIKAPEFGQITSILNNYRTHQQGDMQLYLYGKGSSVGDAAWTLDRYFGQKGSSNFGRYYTKEFNDLLAKQYVETNADNRKKLLRDLQQMIVADNAAAALYYEGLVYGVRNRVKDLVFRPDEMIDYDKARSE